MFPVKLLNRGSSPIASCFYIPFFSTPKIEKSCCDVFDINLWNWQNKRLDMLDYFSLGVHYMFQSTTCSMFSHLSPWLFWGPKKGMSPSVRSPPVSSEAEWPPFARTTPGIWPSMGSFGPLGPFGNEKQQVMGAVHGIPSKVWTSATFGKALAKCSSITSTLLIALCGYTNVYSITGTGLSSPAAVSCRFWCLFPTPQRPTSATMPSGPEGLPLDRGEWSMVPVTVTLL